MSQNDKGTILIADDDPLSLKTTEQHVLSFGYACHCVEDGHAALRELQSRSYDLLISDIMMPGNPQLEMVRQVPTVAPGMPVILVTGNPTVETAVESLRLPIMAYLIKPYRGEELRMLLEKAIEYRRLSRAGGEIFERIGEWSRHADAMRGHVTGGSNSLRMVDVSHFLALSIGNMLNAISDMQSLVLSRGGEPAMLPCRLAECPQYRDLATLAEETVRVLEESKQYVKSKKLSDLRKSWQILLKH